MSYDLEIATSAAVEIVPAKASIESSVKFHGADLEAIVTLLELAAISLTSQPEDMFTADELYGEACRIGGEGVSLERADVDIVMDKAAFLKKERKKYRLR